MRVLTQRNFKIYDMNDAWCDIMALIFFFCPEPIAIGSVSKTKYETGVSFLTPHPVKPYAGPITIGSGQQ
jgi:hypothetical protein